MPGLQESANRTLKLNSHTAQILGAQFDARAVLLHLVQGGLQLLGILVHAFQFAQGFVRLNVFLRHQTLELTNLRIELDFSMRAKSETYIDAHRGTRFVTVALQARHFSLLQMR